MQDDRRYHHIIDPRSGYPADNALASVTLLGKNGAELDALATACMVQGLDQSIRMLRRRKISGLFFLSNGQMFATGEMQKRLKEMNQYEKTNYIHCQA
jgi:thiamine biosynthesis lipoprotein